MSENINTLPNRFENYIIEKPSEYRVLNNDNRCVYYIDKNNNAFYLDIKTHEISFWHQSSDSLFPINVEYSRYIDLNIKNEKKLFKRSKKIVERYIKREDFNCNIE